MDLTYIVNQATAGISRVNTNQATIRSQQAEGYQYYYRMLPAKRIRLDETGRPTDESDGSEYVAATVWDSVESLVSAATEAFSPTRQPVQYTPAMRPDVEEANDYARTVFYEQNQGTTIIRDAMQRAGIAKTGPVAVYWDTSTQRESFEQILPREDFELLAADENITIESADFDPESDSVNVVYSVLRPKNEIRIETVDPEKFGIDGTGLGVREWNMVFHHEYIRAEELIAQGYDPETVRQLPENEYQWDEPRKARDSFDRSSRDHSGNGRFNTKLITHAFLKTALDEDESEIQTVYLRYGYNTQAVLDFKIVDDHFYALFEVHPIAGKAVGQSLADTQGMIQNSESHSVREILNNVALANRDRTEIDETAIYPEEKETVRNQAAMLGGTYFVRRAGAIQNVPRLPMPRETLPILEYLARQSESRSGYSRVAQGMNPDAIAKQNAESTIDKYAALGTKRIAEIVRYNADGALTRIYRLIYDLAIEHADVLDGTIIEVNGQQRPVFPSRWMPRPSMTTKPVLTRDERAARAQGLLAWDRMMLERMEKNSETQHMYQSHNALYVYQEIADLLGFPVEKVMTTPDQPAFQASVAQAQEAQTQAQAQAEQQAQIQAEQARVSLEQMRAAIFADTQKNLADIARDQEKQDLDEEKFDWEQIMDLQELRLEEKQKRQVKFG